ncbi:NAD(P)H-dependent oxidoreductase [Vibrio marisflavi]|uniref:Glutathione-regulated potassium-efflux system ancillary protein KefG n=1 Tax=Vibrio marisflavi CECT 7928 TaxID=634439 RepID=A0ABN8E367_9VIBR|nr:NAD(P)H-dependent oxidoreductase [Vibrio marisflavi]CAH0538952.1 Glutathione-regulated potassium-efflux system ancillary protein KefG [Vibrio marisflavi CECT 7928]
MTKNRVLILYAHPSQRRSEVNEPLFSKAKTIENITCVDLYAEYPTYDIDIDKEQQRLLAHDIIVFQFPLYWYSTPSILKEWQDLVLEYDFAYGLNGSALQGKVLMCAISAGGKAEAYQTDGYNHFTIRELLYPIEQTANLTGMKYIAPFAIFGSRTAMEEGRLDAHVNQYQRLLTALVENRVDLDKASRVEKLNHSLDELIKGESK